MLFGPDKVFVTLDPAAQKPVFSVYTINYNRLEVKIYAVQPADWPDFQRLPARVPAHRPPGLAIPGRLVADKTLPVESRPIS
jgi:alpha-2-macroglobulin